MKVRSILQQVIALTACVYILGTFASYAIDIPAITWTQRSDWINIKTDSRVSPHAVGNGVTDDTAAIQSALDVMNNDIYNGEKKTVYFPSGTYKITSTLQFNNGLTRYNLLGCGINTTIVWAGPTGGAMVWPNSSSAVLYDGFVWDGNHTAGCAFLEYSDIGGYSGYMTAIRHVNESFRNFDLGGSGTPYSGGSYITTGGTHSESTGAIVSGFTNTYGATPVGELTAFNCKFTNCSVGLNCASEITNNFMWVVNGCEFENCGVGFCNGQGYDNVVLNSHFQGSTLTDLGYDGGGTLRGMRLTSTGSNMFFAGPTRGEQFQDCWVDSWTNSSGAVELLYDGQANMVNCTFTNPPSGGTPPIYTVSNSSDVLQLSLSNVVAPNFPTGPGIIHSYGTPYLDFLPAGSIPNAITSASETFLNSTAINDSTHIIDVTQSPYNAVPNNFSVDSTAAIQAAINAAITANNGSVVYIPGGLYKITSMLTASGGNYTIEGEGVISQLCWCSTSPATMMTITSPQNMIVRNVHFSGAANVPGQPNYDSTKPTCDANAVTGIKTTSSSACNITFNNVVYDGFPYGNPGASGGGFTSPGLQFSGLPAGSKVFIPILSSPLTVQDCGPAQIFSEMAYMGAVNISGATQPKTGYLALGVPEGGTFTAGTWNFTITDNQNLLTGPYYSEQSANDVLLSNGSSTTPGHVSIQGMNSAPTATSLTIDSSNYAGRLFYGQAFVTGGASATNVQVQGTGTNPIDLVLADNYFYGSAPTISLGSGANLVSTTNRYGSGTVNFMAEVPNPPTQASQEKITQGYDDFQQLGALDLSMQYGLGSGLVGYWKLDEPSGPAADSSANSLTGTWMNSPVTSTDTPPQIPYEDKASMSFNGTNQYVDMGNPGQLPSGYQARTICGWGKANSTAGGYRWIAAFGSPGTSQAMFIGMNGTTLVGGGYGDDINIGNFWDNNWHFIALTYDGTTAKLYADGYLVGSAAKSWNLVPQHCYIGEQVNNGGEFWNGNIDDVRIYNYALSDAQIAALGSGLVGRWTLDESSGSTSYDSSPNGLIGAWQNSPTFSTSVPPAITYTDAGSLTFNGSNQYVTMGNPVQLPSGYAPRTICGWAKNNGAPSGWHWIAAFGSPGTDQAMFIGANGTSLYGGGYADDLAISNFWDGNWHFIALTYDGTTAKLYADGTLVSSGTKNWNLVPSACYIGEQVNNASEFWNGSIDDVRIFNRVLSAGEISSLAAGNLNP